MKLTPAQRTALRGLAAPVLLCRHFTLEHHTKEPVVCWFLYCPQEYACPEYWSLTDEEGEALVAAGLVAGIEMIYPSYPQPESKVTTYRITDAGRQAVERKLKRLRKRATEKETEVSVAEQNGNALRPVPRGAVGRAADPGAGQGTLPGFDPVEPGAGEQQPHEGRSLGQGTPGG